MLELNLDFLFLLKGLLLFLLALALLLFRKFSRTSVMPWLAAYLFLSGAHSWLHMCTLGMQPVAWVDISLNLTQIAAWFLLSIAAAEVLHSRFPAWKIRFWPSLPVLLSVPLLVPQLASLHAAIHWVAGGFSVVLACIAFCFFSPLHERFKNLLRLVLVFILLPAISSVLYPFAQTCTSCSLHSAVSFWTEALEVFSLLAAFITLHVFFVQIS